MKKYLFLLLAMLSLNLIGMEKSDIEQETQEISPIESIPDELLVMILERVVWDCLIIDNMDAIKVLGRWDNLELVSKRFKKCEDYIIKRAIGVHLDEVVAKIEELNSVLTSENLDKLKSNFAGLKECAADTLKFLHMRGLHKELKQLFKKVDIALLDSGRLAFCCNAIIAILAKGANPNLVIKFKYDGKTKYSTVLCIAIKIKNFSNLVRFLLLLRAGFLREVDLNLPDSNGRTPFMIALSENNYELADNLLNHGANPNLCDKKMRTSLIIAIRYCKDFDTLLTSGLLNKLLDFGIDVNAQDNDGRNAFYEAICTRNSEKVIDLLCQYGLSVNNKIKILKDHKLFGVRLNIKKSTLGWAVYFMNKEVVQLLLDKGASINGRYNEVQSVIKYAREDLHIESNPRMNVILQMLIDKEKEDLDLGGVSFCAIC